MPLTVVPTEIRVLSRRSIMVVTALNDRLLKNNVVLVDELRNGALIRVVAYH